MRKWMKKEWFEKEVLQEQDRMHKIESKSERKKENEETRIKLCCQKCQITEILSQK